MSDYDLIKHCCDALKEAVESSYGIFEVMAHEPFRPDHTHAPTLFALSEGGHGGWETCSHCPFCGQKVEPLEPEKWTPSFSADNRPPASVTIEEWGESEDE